jgi:hypothetical protein
VKPPALNGVYYGWLLTRDVVFYTDLAGLALFCVLTLFDPALQKNLNSEVFQQSLLTYCTKTGI